MAENQVTQKDYHIISDPVHGSMRFSPEESSWITPFIDSENFQRLRHIKQAGLADWFFIGAVHSRFSHCIGSCYLASQVCNQLGLSSEERQLAMLAGLLHDIGHGPFSHVFEAVFRGWCIRHEMWTPMFLQDYANSTFLDVFNRVNKDYPLSIEKMKVMQDLIVHHARVDNRLLADIISSQLDVDRLDYLLRDSHFFGVNYGLYDIQWLLHCLTIIEKEGQKRLGINYKGVGAVEHYLMARRLMIRNVYQHSKKYAAEFLLQQFLKQVSFGIAEDPYFETLSQKPLVQFLKQVNRFNQEAKHETHISALKEAFVRDNYDLYKQLCDYDVFSLIRRISHWDHPHMAVTIARRLQSRQLPKVFQISEANFERVSSLISDFRSKHPSIRGWQLSLLVLPHLAYKVDENPILMKDFVGRVQYLQDISLMIGAISDKRERSYLVSIDVEIERQLEEEGFLKVLKGL